MEKTLPSSSRKHHITFEPTLKEKVSASEALWVFKVAQDDLSLRGCDGIPSLFQKMFPGSNVGKSLTMSKQKASYVLQDRLGPLLSQWLATKLKKLKGTFSIMFDETTHQNKKQMDVLLRFWDEGENQVVINYLTSIHFAKAKAVDITKMLFKLEEEECLSVPWSRLCNISTWIQYQQSNF